MEEQPPGKFGKGVSPLIITNVMKSGLTPSPDSVTKTDTLYSPRVKHLRAFPHKLNRIAPAYRKTATRSSDGPSTRTARGRHLENRACFFFFELS
jgi:hypothetical protein